MQNMKESFNILGKRIRQLRKERKWTQAELAEKIDKTTEMVCHLENGTASTKIKTLKIIADVFEVDITELFKEKDDFDMSSISGARLKLFEELEDADEETVELVAQLIHNLNNKN